LNTTCRKLSPQQIRVAIYQGKFLDLLHYMNNNNTWRSIFGSRSATLKDQELILRFLALYYDIDNYGKSDDTNTIKGFLNKFVEKNRFCNDEFCKTSTELFNNTIKVVYQTFGERAFRPERVLTAAVYDSVMVGIAKRLEIDNKIDSDRLFLQYNKLQQDADYINSISRATSNVKSFEERCRKAIDAFCSI
jgi:hypothetical protein